jgi:hypothetical protein
MAYRDKNKRKEYMKKYMKEYNKSHPTRKYDRNYHLVSTYNLTLEDYNKMFEEQHGCCAICGRHQSEFKRSLAIDHNHITYKVRGLLCNNCNRAIGLLQVDELGIELLVSAISYLRNNDVEC